MTNVTELVAHHFILFLGFYPSPLPEGRRRFAIDIDFSPQRADLQTPNPVRKRSSRTTSLESSFCYLYLLLMYLSVAVFEIFLTNFNVNPSIGVESYRAGEALTIIWEVSRRTAESGSRGGERVRRIVARRVIAATVNRSVN